LAPRRGRSAESGPSPPLGYPQPVDGHAPGSAARTRTGVAMLGRVRAGTFTAAPCEDAVPTPSAVIGSSGQGSVMPRPVLVRAAPAVGRCRCPAHLWCARGLHEQACTRRQLPAAPTPDGRPDLHKRVRASPADTRRDDPHGTANAVRVNRPSRVRIPEPPPLTSTFPVASAWQRSDGVSGRVSSGGAPPDDDASTAHPVAMPRGISLLQARG
jgi:hypothetical protein